MLLTTPQKVGTAIVSAQKEPLAADDGQADKTTAPQPQSDPQTATKTVTAFNPQLQSPEPLDKKRMQTTTLSQFFKRV